MIQYLLGYACFLLGVAMHILGKIKEYRAMAEANPDPKVVYSTKTLFRKEWPNFAQLLLGGVALVIFAPKLIGGVMVDFKSTSGQVIATVTMETVLMPFYFLMAYAGNSAMLNFFGQYKKTLLNRVSVDAN